MYSPQDVREVRRKTNASIEECQDALTATQGDVQGAINMIMGGGAPKAKTASSGAVSQDKVNRLQQLSGKPREQCIFALEDASGNVNEAYQDMQDEGFEPYYETITEMRERTGKTISQCRFAFLETEDGNVEQAIEWLLDPTFDEWYESEMQARVAKAQSSSKSSNGKPGNYYGKGKGIASVILGAVGFMMGVSGVSGTSGGVLNIFAIILMIPTLILGILSFVSFFKNKNKGVKTPANMVLGIIAIILAFLCFVFAIVGFVNMNAYYNYYY